MYQQEIIKPYTQDTEKASQVEQMFDNIAPTYDVLNHRLSWDIDRGWRRKAIGQLAPYKPKTMLDIATGTGDFAILAAKMLQPERLIGADISEGMMEIGRKKVVEAGLGNVITFAKEDCLHLSYEAETFDAVTAAFGIRNFADLDQGLKEMCRVLKKGGHLSIVELTTPPRFPMKQLFNISLRAHHLKGQQCLLLSDEDHRGFSTRRTHDGNIAESRLQQNSVQPTDIRNMHHVFCNQIKKQDKRQWTSMD